MGPAKQSILNIALIVLILLENFFLFFSYNEYHFTQAHNAKALFLSSLLFGAVYIYKFYKQEVGMQLTSFKKLSWRSWILLIPFITSIIWLVVRYDHIFKGFPVSVQSSDIIPTIQVACRRFLSGQYVYNQITEFGYTLPLTYLPMQWLPFTFAELGHFDYRWIPFAIWTIAALVLFLRCLRTGNVVWQCIALVLILGGNSLVFFKSEGVLTMTVELMVAGYYILFVSGLNTRNAVLAGLIISVCLLSRYSLLLWLPLAFFVLLVAKQRKFLLIAAITAVLTVLVIYVIPFLSKDWGSFYRGYKYYDQSALFEWGHMNENGYPGHLFSGTGFAYIFYYKLSSLDLMQRIKMLQKTHLFLSLGSTVVMGVWYWFNRKKINYRIFLSGSFKIYLTFFLAFIQVPYEYLMIVGNFVSIAMFCEQLRYKPILSAAS
jgi:hypothetical protein